MEKSFLISIDTEGDNLWRWENEAEITTQNADFLPRFQNLSEKYGFKPTYLTNYEMAKSESYVDFAKDTLKRNACEVGMHLHAWNNPPEYDLLNGGKYSAAPYLIEYPYEIMEEKIKTITAVLEDTFERNITSHRSGRWATNEKYFELLTKYGYKVDCSVTPHINWSKTVGGRPENFGSDYTKAEEKPYYISNCYGNILELPMTVRVMKSFGTSSKNDIMSIVKGMYHKLKGVSVWLRPSVDNVKQCLELVENLKKDDSEYIMFMLHSSELMPGGSPNFKNEHAIEV